MQFVDELGLLALGSRMRALSDRLYAIADEVYRGRGLAVQGRWFPLLRLLHDRGPSTVGEIAEAIGQTHSAVSQLADKLVLTGWVSTIADEHDGRRRRLTLTTKSQAELRAAKSAWRAIEQVLGERCQAEGIDVLDCLSRFERLIEPTIASTIVERCTANDRAAVRILPFNSELREHFYRLNAAWLRHYFYLEEIDHRVLSQPEVEILEPGGAIFFAQLGDAVIGTCALKCETAGTYELTKMAVDPGHQGLGVGRLLMEEAIAEFKRRKGSLLFLETSTKLGPALRLYESVGFEYQKALKPDSHYARADVYMVWSDASGATISPRI
ncbi:MAG: bifunctional helix-turn-helix transcriptional regulator/GNAT family N-acetyltransferase [Pseudomarimonas sp.]